GDRLQRRLSREAIDVAEVRAMLFCAQEGRDERIPGQLEQIIAIQTKSRRRIPEVVGDVTAEVRRVVGIHCHYQAAIQQLLEIVVLETLKDPKLHVGE